MDNINEMAEVVQLPIIRENLIQLKERWEQTALDADAAVCTPENIQDIKKKRSDMTKDFNDLEARRKEIKRAIMARYNAFDAIYQDCVTNSYNAAYATLTKKINDIEADIKARCEDDLRNYFDELCAVHHLDWLTYERAGVKVDLTSAKAKTPKKLREQLAAFVAGVAESVDRINSLEDSGESMVEYQKSLDAAAAICTVKERHRRIEEAKAMSQARAEIRAVEEEHIRRVEALAPPIQVVPPEPIVRCTFSVKATRSQLRKLKKFLDMEGIEYE